MVIHYDERFKGAILGVILEIKEDIEKGNSEKYSKVLDTLRKYSKFNLDFYSILTIDEKGKLDQWADEKDMLTKLKLKMVKDLSKKLDDGLPKK